MACQLTNETIEPAAPTQEQQGADAPDSIAKLATVGTLACMLAHEMNNLLTPVLSYAQLALDAPANERLGRRAHESAVAGVNACNAMAKSLLGFAQTELGVEPVANISTCVQGAIDCIPRDLTKDGITPAIDIDPRIVAAIAAPELVQILLNLVLNARQAMPSGGALTVRAECSTGNTVLLSVSDTGQGILPENLQAIFDPFVSRTAGNTGTGLGLTICKKLVSAANGTISVESTEGLGTTFTLTLPAVVASENVAA